MVASTSIAIESSGPEPSRLVDSTREGREVIITRAGQPVAKIVPIISSKTHIQAGYGKGTVLHMADDFDAPLPDFDEEK